MSKQQNRRPRSNRDSRTVDKLNDKQLTKSNSSRGQRRLKEEVDTAVRNDYSKRNDYSWYAKFPQFTKDAGTLAFGIPLGQPIDLGDGTDFLTVPGIMRISYIPTIGYSDSLASPINRSALRFYTYLRDIQKAASKYDVADVMMYLMAIDSCYAFHALMKRAYGVAQLFTPVNKYYPRTLLQCMGFDPSIADNLADFRATINRFALNIGRFAMPTGFDITVRHQWMNEGLYVDSESTRAQTYVFVPEGFWKFNNTVTTGSQLDWVPWMSTNKAENLHTLAQVQQFADQLLTAIYNDQDTGNISGDLYSAFAGKLMKIEEVPSMYSIMPAFNQRVLSQIENATLVGGFAPTYTPVISQDPSVNNGAIIFKPTFAGNSEEMYDSSDNSSYFNPIYQAPGQLLNMHMDSPSAEDVIEATRLTAGTSKATASADAQGIALDMFGADVASRMTIYVFNASNPAAVSPLWITTNSILVETGAAVSNPRVPFTTAQAFALMEAFDWHPMVYLSTYSSAKAGSKADIQQVFADVDNLTYASGPQLAMMHEASMLSLFDVPQMAN